MTEYNYTEKYMLTVVYGKGKTIDISFNSKEDRKEFFSILNGYEFLTFWEKLVETEDLDDEDDEDDMTKLDLARQVAFSEIYD